MSRAVLIVLEGIDGAGTTTQAARLVEALRADGLTTHQTREPSDGPVGKLLRDMLSGSHATIDGTIDATTMSLLFAADRADHLQREVEPALARGEVVISDRWYHSSLAYQGDSEERAWITQLNARARRPDRTIFLEVPARVAATRRSAAGRTEEIFDALPMQERIAANYLEVIDSLRSQEAIDVVDGEQSADAVAAQVLALARETCHGRAPS